MGHRDTVADIASVRMPVPWPAAAAADADAEVDAAPEVAPPEEGQGLAAPSRWHRFAALAALVLAAAAVAAWYFAAGRQVPPPVATATAQIATIEDIVTATGTVQPLEYVDVGTQVTGQLSRLHVAVGDLVKRGQLLAEIDPTVFEARVATGRAQLQNLRAQLREREAQARLADLVRDRNRQLHAADAVSEEAMQQTDAAAVQAHAQVDAVRAQMEQAQSALTGDEANLRYTHLYAPMAGTVVALNARQGQTLVSSQQAPVILRIADLSTMTVWAQVSEADVPRVAVGMPVSFNTLGLPDRRWKGRVRQVMPTPETVNNVVLYNVLFDVANPDGALKSQMSTQVFFRVAAADNALAIPVGALQSIARPAPDRKGRHAPGKEARVDKTYLVRVVDEAGRQEERTVTVGLQTRMQAQITSGLKAGEEVVLDAGAARPRAGKARKPAE